VVVVVVVVRSKQLASSMCWFRSSGSFPFFYFRSDDGIPSPNAQFLRQAKVGVPMRWWYRSTGTRISSPLAVMAFLRQKSGS